ncbi:orf109-like protein [Peridroma alphabaculovirus]|uniref:Orf109-like protein n=1 Tax=Peridroma alphabaculovirus TaxID=1346829 RepID=A0A068LMR6_9ABAC|nr:orf109-like protein [Peridroma alphabaculovirus]AIE47821.1 orf109-like protein [Peridroma alphabaculovirus]
MRGLCRLLAHSNGIDHGIDMSLKRLGNPPTLYHLSLNKMGAIVDQHKSAECVKRLLPLMIAADLEESVWAELPPGWYFAMGENRFCVSRYDTDDEVHRQICADWKRSNIADYHAAINRAVHGLYHATASPPNDDTRRVYTNLKLIRERLIDLFNIGDHLLNKRRGVMEYVPCVFKYKYVKLVPGVHSAGPLKIVRDYRKKDYVEMMRKTTYCSLDRLIVYSKRIS